MFTKLEKYFFVAFIFMSGAFFTLIYATTPGHDPVWAGLSGVLVGLGNLTMITALYYFFKVTRKHRIVLKDVVV